MYIAGTLSSKITFSLVRPRHLGCSSKWFSGCFVLVLPRHWVYSFVFFFLVVVPKNVSKKAVVEEILNLSRGFQQNGSGGQSGDAIQGV